MQLTEAVFMVFLVLGVSSVLGALIFSRHRERMNMIERGMKADEIRLMFEKQGRPWSPLSSLKWGIVLVGIGAAILLGLWLHEVYGVPGGVFPALIAIFGGASLVLYYIIARKKEPL